MANKRTIYWKIFKFKLFNNKCLVSTKGQWRVTRHLYNTILIFTYQLHNVMKKMQKKSQVQQKSLQNKKEQHYSPSQNDFQLQKL